MKKILFLLLMVLTLPCFAQDNIINDKNAQARTVGSFNSIKVSGAIEVYLSQGGSEALAVSASEEKFRDKIKTEISNGTLKIWYDGDRISWSGDKKMRAYVSFKTLSKLEASGASGYHITGTLNVPTLDVMLSGASDMKGTVNISTLTVDLHGASDVKLNGSVGSIKIEASGASDVKGYDLVADACTATVSGASDVNITVNKELSAHATGASSVYYKGNAVVTDIHSSGASSISKKG